MSLETPVPPWPTSASSTAQAEGGHSGRPTCETGCSECTCGCRWAKGGPGRDSTSRQHAPHRYHLPPPMHHPCTPRPDNSGKQVRPPGAEINLLPACQLCPQGGWGRRCVGTGPEGRSLPSAWLPGPGFQGCGSGLGHSWGGGDSPWSPGLPSLPPPHHAGAGQGRGQTGDSLGSPTGPQHPALSHYLTQLSPSQRPPQHPIYKTLHPLPSK